MVGPLRRGLAGADQAARGGQGACHRHVQLQAEPSRARCSPRRRSPPMSTRSSSTRRSRARRPRVPRRARHRHGVVEPARRRAATVLDGAGHHRARRALRPKSPAQIVLRWHMELGGGAAPRSSEPDPAGREPGRLRLRSHRRERWPRSPRSTRVKAAARDSDTRGPLREAGTSHECSGPWAAAGDQLLLPGRRGRLRAARRDCRGCGFRRHRPAGRKLLGRTRRRARRQGDARHPGPTRGVGPGGRIPHGLGHRAGPDAGTAGEGGRDLPRRPDVRRRRT